MNAPPTEQEIAIAVRGIGKSFGEKKIYEKLDLDVRRGETLTILGPSGTGKSVLLKLIIGLLTPDCGSILAGGVEVVGLDERALRPVRKKVAMLFQGAALFDSMTVGDNIAYGLREQGEATDEVIRARVAECLEWVGLAGNEAMAPASLSGGMKKRVGLARALAPGPEIILYDEPTTGLGPSNARRINELIISLQEKLHVTSLVITHDMGSAFEISDRVALVEDFRIDLILDAAEAEKSPPPQLKKFIEGHADGESQ